MTPVGFAWLASGLAIGLAALGTGLGIGHLVGRSVEATARQPEKAAVIQRMMLMGIVFIEAICLYAFVISLLLVLKHSNVTSAEPDDELGRTVTVHAVGQAGR